MLDISAKNNMKEENPWHQQVQVFMMFQYFSTKGSTISEQKRELTVTVRTTPPLAPSRAIARETTFTTNFCKYEDKKDQLEKLVPILFYYLVLVSRQGTHGHTSASSSLIPSLHS